MTAPRRFSFADSEVAAVSVDGDTLRVRFAAAQVAEADTTTFSGWRHGLVAGVELVCRGGPWPAPEAHHAGRLAAGRVRDAHGGLGTLPLPSELDGVTALELQFANRSELSVPVVSVSITWPRDAAWTDSLAC